jgi:hypothetical protein
MGVRYPLQNVADSGVWWEIFFALSLVWTWCSPETTMEVVRKEERDVFGRASSRSNRCVVVYDENRKVAFPNIQRGLTLNIRAKLP